MARDKERTVRYQRKSVSWEITFLRWVLIFLLAPLIIWFIRRLKPILYHPIAWPAILFFTWLAFTNFVLMIVLLLLHIPALAVWSQAYPASFHTHAIPRLKGFFAGWNYRYRPRRRLSSNKVLSKEDPPPTISRVQVHGSLHRIWLKMNDGDDIELWRQWATNIAQTYNAGDCQINPYRRPAFTGYRIQGISRKGWRIHVERGQIGLVHNGVMADKWRWLEIEFMKKNPFAKVVGHEFIDYHRNDELALTEGSVVGMRRDGKPYRLNVERHLLVFAMTQWGKSSTLRTMVYADRHEVARGRREKWLIELKRGVEGSTMQGQFARHEYGLNGPERVLQFVMELKAVMDSRLDTMREAGVTHYWEIGLRRIDFYVDEWLSFEEPEYQQVKNQIYRAFAAVFNRGAAAGVLVTAFAQQPKKDKFELKDHFNEVWVGAMKNENATRMATDDDIPAHELPLDLRGVFYAGSDAGRMPDSLRVCLTPRWAVQELPQCPASIYQPPPIQGFFPTTPPMPADSLTAVPEDVTSEEVENHEAEPEPVGAGPGRLTDLR